MSYKIWTEQEEEYLINKYGKTKISEMAKRLNRTESSVEKKIKRMKLGPSFENQDEFTAVELSRTLGRSRSIILNWIYSGKLKATLKVTGKKKKYQMIKPKDFWNFAKDNPKLMKWEKFERGIIIPEPEWLDEEIEKYMRNRYKNNDKKWSKMEDCLLINYYKKGIQLKEIGKLMGRTEYAIWNHAKRLKISRRSIQIPWKEEEKDIAIYMREKGYTYRQIAEELGRSEKGVQRFYDRHRQKNNNPNLTNN